jgi:hypothetical protein
MNESIQILERMKLRLVIKQGDAAIEQHKLALKHIRAKQRRRRAELARFERPVNDLQTIGK